MKVKNNFYIKGISLLEAIVSTAIIGIGFVAILQMTNYSVSSIGISSERTKANFLTNMIAEDTDEDTTASFPFDHIDKTDTDDIDYDFCNDEPKEQIIDKNKYSVPSIINKYSIQKPQINTK